MAANVKTKLGRMPCENCGEPVTVRQAESKTLSYTCDGCDKSAYAKWGTDCARSWLAKLPTPEPSPAPAPVAATAPAPGPAAPAPTSTARKQRPAPTPFSMEF